MKALLLSSLLTATFLVVAESSARADGSTVFVHIESDRHVRLESNEYGDWRWVCDSPCDRDLPLGVDFRIGGDEVRRSRPFRLHGRAGTQTRLDVSTSSKAWFNAGIVGVSAGPALAAVASAVAFGYAIGGDESHTHAWEGIAIGGLAMTAVGLTLLLANLSSSAEQSYTWPTAVSF
jgi:hypothetical protein